MSAAAVGVVGLVVGVVIIGGILFLITRPGGDGNGPGSVALPTVTTTETVADLGTPSGVLPASGVDRQPSAVGADLECDAGEPCLRVSVDGPGAAVSFVLRDNVTEVTCTSSCEASFPEGVAVHLYRTRNLTEQQELGARMTAWSGDCAEVVAEEEPRGGTCNLVMDDDHEVGASFEIRPRLEIQVQGAPGYFNLEYQPEQVFAPAPRGDRLGCGNPPCRIKYFYDLGTAVTMNAGYRSVSAQTADTLTWSGACSGVAGWDRTDVNRPDDEGEPCTVTLTGDTVVTMEFGASE